MRQKRFRKPTGNKLAQTSVDNALSQLQVFRDLVRTGTETGLILHAKRLVHSLQYRLIPLIVTFGLMSDPFNSTRVGGEHGIQVDARLDAPRDIRLSASHSETSRKLSHTWS